jgi:hypothetical protein
LSTGNHIDHPAHRTNNHIEPSFWNCSLTPNQDSKPGFQTRILKQDSELALRCEAASTRTEGRVSSNIPNPCKTHCSMPCIGRRRRSSA